MTRDTAHTRDGDHGGHGGDHAPGRAPGRVRAAGERAAAAKGRLTIALAGLALMGFGAYGLATHLDLPGWAVWFAGAAIAHDGVLAPAVLAAGLATTRLRPPYRRIVQAALVTGATVTLVSLPLVLGYGRRADTPSRLPLPYGRNLLIVLAAITALAALAAAAHALTHRHTTRRQATKGGPRR